MPSLADYDPARQHLPDLTLHRMDPDAEAGGILFCSLPVPPGAPTDLTLDGRGTYAKPLGQWPDASGPAPRRLLLAADGGPQRSAALPASVRPMRQSQAGASPATPTPTASMKLLERSPHEGFLWERHSCLIEWQGRQTEIRLGLRKGDALHWWEYCMLEVEEETPFCRVVHMAGSIPHQLTTFEDMCDPERQNYHAPLLHEHHWLSGHLWLRMYANGVVEVHARHTNSRYVDDGLPLDDCVPVIAVRTTDPGDLPGPWDGTRTGFSLDGVAWDVTETARLATPAQPGSMAQVDDWLVWQPYMGVDVFSGRCAEGRMGDPYIWHAEQHHFPRGMSRTLRCSFSLGDRSPRIVRYQAPYYWYGLCGELQHAPYLPVSDAHDAILDEQRDWLHVHAEPGGFEDGSIPRGAPCPPLPERPEGSPKPRWECGWEGDAPHGMFMLAWRTGSWTDHHIAMRNAYHFTDVIIDHAVNLVRMHGFPPVAFAQPGYRVIGTLAAYLETGDPYLLESAEAVTEAAWRNHLNSWPRPAIGRDACFVRGAVLLWRYFANPHFRDIARKVCHHAALVQRPNGSWGDQSGGAGIHGWGAYITKPWMALLCTMPQLDYLELFPDDAVVHAAVMKTADWLMSCRFLHENGVTGWSYQHDYDGQPRFYNFFSQEWTELPGKTKNWHMDNFGRLLGYAALHTGDPAYLDAFEENATGNGERGGYGDHSIAASQLSLPRLQSWLWRPVWTLAGVTITPFRGGTRLPKTATLLSPDGPLPVAWKPDGTVSAPPGVTVSP